MRRVVACFGQAALLLLFAIGFQSLRAIGQGTVFTYQGQLNAGGVPANGTYSMVFYLYDVETNGSPLDNVAVASVAVTNGLFTTPLAFSPGSFDGNDRWLEISVEKVGDGSFTTLAPRQKFTATPYAIMAGSASNLVGVVQNSSLPANPSFSGAATANVFVGSGAGLTNLNAAALPRTVAMLNSNQLFLGQNSFVTSVGIGAPAPPQGSLQVFGGILARGGPPGPNGSYNNGYAFSGNSGDDDSGMFSMADGQIQFFNNANLAMSIVNGNVGIGVPIAASPLQVNGDVRLGSGGQDFAASSTENLRIVRGTINGNGTIAWGAGFSVSHTPGSGGYAITFSPPFSGSPSVTVTAVDYGARAGSVLNSSTVTVGTVNFGTGAPVDDTFSFIAVGPP